MSNDSRMVLLKAGARICALPVESVVETMRPLPVAEVAGAPAWVLGVAMIRGAPLPVVDLDAMLGGRRATDVSRFVTVRVAERQVALAVAAVLGVRAIAPATLGAMPPLLSDAGAAIVEALGVLDRELCLVVRAGRLMPEALWTSLTAAEPRGASAQP